MVIKTSLKFVTSSRVDLYISPRRWVYQSACTPLPQAIVVIQNITL